MSKSEKEAQPHLQVEVSDRGFQRLPAIPGTYGGEVEAYESSAADGAHVWLKATESKKFSEPEIGQVEAYLHLTVESARNLADQLNYLVDFHYQRDNDHDE